MSPTSPGREALGFLALTYLLALGTAAALPHAGINRLLTLLVPAAAVLLMSAATNERGARKKSWREIGIGRPRRPDPGAWLLALAVPVALLGAAYGVAVAVRVADVVRPSTDPADVASFVADLAISLVLGTVLVLGEEIGWRGYLLPRLQQLTDHRRAAVLTGFAHGCFHLPLILVATTYDSDGARWFVAPSVVVTITAAGVFYAYLRDRTQNLWPVAFAHNAANTLFDVGSRATVATGSAASLAYVAGESGIATMAAVLLLAVVLLRLPGWGDPAATASVAGVPR